MSLAADMCDRAATLWHVQRVKRMVRERARLGSHALVSVSEIPCDDHACPGPATQITILGLDMVRRGFVIHLPVAAITEADLQVVSA